MNEKLQKYFATKMVAIGFIVLILMGNYWLVKEFTNPGYNNPNFFSIFFIVAFWTICWIIPVTVKYFIIKYETKNNDLLGKE